MGGDWCSSTIFYGLEFNNETDLLEFFGKNFIDKFKNYIMNDVNELSLNDPLNYFIEEFRENDDLSDAWESFWKSAFIQRDGGDHVESTYRSNEYCSRWEGYDINILIRDNCFYKLTLGIIIDTVMSTDEFIEKININTLLHFFEDNGINDESVLSAVKKNAKVYSYIG